MYPQLFKLHTLIFTIPAQIRPAGTHGDTPYFGTQPIISKTVS